MNYPNRLFTYGTLTFQEVMIHLLGRKIQQTKATINGYSAFMVKGQDFPALRKTTNNSLTNGIVYSELEPRDWEIIDEFEDYFYDRKIEEITLWNGERKKAFTYIVSPKYYHLLDSCSWDSEIFRRNSLSSYLDMIIGFNNK